MRYLAYLVFLMVVAGCIGEKVERTECFTSKHPEMKACNSEKDLDSRDACYKDVALRESNAVLCEDVCRENQRNLCYHMIAKKVGDINLCQKIKNDDWRYNNCIQSATAP